MAEGKGDKGEKVEETETTIPLADCPKVVQDTISKEADGGNIKEIEKETEQGKTTFSADVTIGGKATGTKRRRGSTKIRTERENAFPRTWAGAVCTPAPACLIY
jgi:hypothetical protein